MPLGLGEHFGHLGSLQRGAMASLPAWMYAPLQADPPDIYGDLTTNQEYVRAGNIIRSATPQWTISRATGDTQVDSLGNWASFGSNLWARSDLGASMWDAGTNICLQSQFAPASIGTTWAMSLTGGTVASNTTDVLDVRGTNAALKLTVTAASAGGFYQGGIPVVASTLYTLSFFVQLGTLAASDLQYAIYNETGSAFIAQGIGITFTPAANGWMRVTNTFTTAAGQTALRIYPFRAGNTGTGTVYISDVQVELGNVATNLIATTSSAASRSPTYPIYNMTGLSIGPQATMWAEAVPRAPIGQFNGLMEIDDNTANNRAVMRRDSTGAYAALMASAGTSTYNTSTGAWPTNTIGREVYAYANGDEQAYGTGAALTPGTGAALINPTFIRAGASGPGSLSFRGDLRKYAFWLNRRVPNANAQPMV